MKLKCDVPDCTYEADKPTETKAAQALRMHKARVHFKNVGRKPRKKYSRRDKVTEPSVEAKYGVNFCPHCGCPVGQPVLVAVNLEKLQ